MQVGFPGFGSDLAGLRKAVAAMRREAQTVTHASVDGSPADLAGAMVRGQENARAAQASAETIRQTDQSLGSVIDIVT